MEEIFGGNRAPTSPRQHVPFLLGEASLGGGAYCSVFCELPHLGAITLTNKAGPSNQAPAGGTEVLSKSSLIVEAEQEL